MSKKQSLFLIAVLLVVWLLFISLLRNNLSSGSRYVRWFNDDADRWVYMLRGEWLPSHSLPYVNVASEYPQVPTYLFGLLHVFTSPSSPPEAIYFTYSAIFSLLMLVVLFFTIRMLYGMLTERKWLAFLMLLPGTLYFTFNRFDILPAFLTLWSFWLLRRQKSIATGILLGIGALTKWYPALLLPVYLSYEFALWKRLNWKMILAFVIAVALIALPTLLTGGLAAFLSPYLLHAGRGFEQVSLPELFRLFLGKFGLQPSTALLAYVFLLLQLLPTPISLFARVDTEEKLLQWIILILGAFILFSRIYSPQWLLWLMPFLILAARNWFDIAWAIIYNVAIYLIFPVTIDVFGIESVAYQIGGIVTAVILVVVWGVAFARQKISFAWNFLDPVLGPIRHAKSAKKIP